MKYLVEILASVIPVYRKNFSLLIGYSAWLLIPFTAFFLLSFAPDHTIVQSIAFALSLVELLFLSWISILLALYSRDLLLGQPTETRTLSERAKALIPPVLTVFLIQMLVMFGGFFLLIIPGFIFAVWFGLSTFVAIFEDKRGLNALSTSRELTKGSFWKTAQLLILGPFLVIFFYSFLFSLIISIYASAQNIDPITLLTEKLPLWINVLEAVGEIVLIPFLVMYLTQAYLVLKKTPVQPVQLEKEAEIA